MRHAGSTMLIDQRAGSEAVERERRSDLMRLTLRDSMGENNPGARNRLEAAGTPAAIEIKRFARLLPTILTVEVEQFCS